MSGENYINHIALVLDASWSMHGLVEDVVRVADEQTGHLAKKSTELDQETRITVYTFNDSVKCAIYDKDVLRLPSVKNHYRASGNTALIDATHKALDDLEATAQLYGDHAFLVYVLTDGQENRSYKTAPSLRQRLEKLPENWTVAALVPDQSGVLYAKNVGFPPDNIMVWETTVEGVRRDVGANILRATDAYMNLRSTGVRGTKTLFTMGADTLNRQTVKDAQLKPLAKGAYFLLDVKTDSTIRDFVDSQEGLTFQQGRNFYQLVKTETVQSYKEVIVRNRKSGRLYAGPQARDLLGLPDADVRIKPEGNPDYQVFVQSTSVNRRLPAGTKLVVMV